MAVAGIGMSVSFNTFEECDVSPTPQSRVRQGTRYFLFGSHGRADRELGTLGRVWGQAHFCPLVCVAKSAGTLPSLKSVVQDTTAVPLVVQDTTVVLLTAALCAVR